MSPLQRREKDCLVARTSAAMAVKKAMRFRFLNKLLLNLLFRRDQKKPTQQRVLARS
jgi:hypothetical protein